jgi:ADP-ribosyl-[dinitrogen reductase] hydrolase
MAIIQRRRALHNSQPSVKQLSVKALRFMGGCALVIICMFVFNRMTTITKSAMKQPTSMPRASLSVSETSLLQDRLRKALWSYFAGDALAAPAHWFYGGFAQIQQAYGPHGIVGYVQPVLQLKGSIMNKSDLNGGGRSSGSSSKTKGMTIIGDVINHGKAKYWSPSNEFHYHATLQAGENTLEAQLARVLMQSIVANKGLFDKEHFRDAYVEFMMRPGSHNDAYASTCHRLFFKNLVFEKKSPDKCPDNDHHNVDTVDGLVLPTIASLAVAASTGNAQTTAQAAADCATVTRNSVALERAAAAWSHVVYSSLHEDPSSIIQSAEQAAVSLNYRRPVPQDTMTACYLDSAVPALLDSVVKYAPTSDVWTGLLANANTGGENVHRGSCLGAILGATSTKELDAKLMQGLYDREQLSREIDAFVSAVTSR